MQTVEERFCSSAKRHINAVQKFGKFLGVPGAQLDIHDQSKFSPEELPAYARKYFSERDGAEFGAAWLHHIHHNPHHWEHWIMPSGPWVKGGNGLLTPASNAVFEMPETYALEMIADWAGASLAYNGSFDMTQWLLGNIPRIIVHPKTAEYLKKILRDLNYDDVLSEVDFPDTMTREGGA